MKYTFRGFKPTDNETTVEAANEIQARHLAMVKRWGPPPDIKLGIKGYYQGSGLDLVNVK